MHEILRATSGSPLFEVTAAPYVLLDTELRIQGVNPAYLNATGRSRDDLMGVFMFDAFPDNPEDANATGVRNLGSSLDRVLRRAVPDDMGVQRYDIPRSDAPGAFRRKTWSPVNSPLSDAGGHIVAYCTMSRTSPWWTTSSTTLAGQIRRTPRCGRPRSCTARCSPWHATNAPAAPRPRRGRSPATCRASGTRGETHCGTGSCTPPSGAGAPPAASPPCAPPRYRSCPGSTPPRSPCRAPA